MSCSCSSEPKGNNQKLIYVFTSTKPIVLLFVSQEQMFEFLSFIWVFAKGLKITKEYLLDVIVCIFYNLTVY